MSRILNIRRAGYGFAYANCVAAGLKIVILEDDVFGGGLLAELLTEGGHEVALHRDIAAAVQSIARLRPDVAVVDLDLGDGPSGLEVVGVIKDRFPGTRCVILTAHRSPALVDPHSAHVVGDCTYIVKVDHCASEIVGLIESAAGPMEMSASQPQLSVSELTPEQASLLAQLAQGLSVKAIAAQRGTSLRSVYALMDRLFRSLGISTVDGIDPRAKAVELYRKSAVAIRT